MTVHTQTVRHCDTMKVHTQTVRHSDTMSMHSQTVCHCDTMKVHTQTVRHSDTMSVHTQTVRHCDTVTSNCQTTYFYEDSLIMNGCTATCYIQSIRSDTYTSSTDDQTNIWHGQTVIHSHTVVVYC